MEDNECLVEFRFDKQEIYDLVNVLQLPEVFICNNGMVVDSVAALCICLKRFVYLCRYVDLVPRFGRSVPLLCMISNLVTDHIYERFSNLLTNLDQPWLSPHNLKMYADAIHVKGAALDNCWGFIDGKFQSVTAPNALIASLYGPVEGRTHDSGMLATYGMLQQHSFAPDGQALCIYGRVFNWFFCLLQVINFYAKMRDKATRSPKPFSFLL